MNPKKFLSYIVSSSNIHCRSVSLFMIPIDQVGSRWLSCTKILRDAAMDFKTMAREIVNSRKRSKKNFFFKFTVLKNKKQELITLILT